MLMFRLRFGFKKEDDNLLISHNLQVNSENVPPFDLIQLSKGLRAKPTQFKVSIYLAIHIG